jgi:hypothetical protein
MLVRLICAKLLHLVDYPYGFYVPAADGGDLMTFYPRFQHFHSPEFFGGSHGPPYIYPAAVAPIYWLLYRVRHAQIPFVFFGAGVTFLYASFFDRALQRHGLSRRSAHWFTLIAGLCSYPFYFEFTRGNVEIFMWIITAGAIYAILHERPWLGSVLLGFAIAMKIYPFVFLALLFSRRKYVPIFLSFCVAGIYSLFALWAVCPDLTIAKQGIYKGLNTFRTDYVIPYRPFLSGVDHSLFGFLKRILGPMPFSEYDSILKIYLPSAAVCGIVLYFARIRKLPEINQVLCLTVASIVLPPASYDYTLIHLYTPFARVVLFLVNRYRTGQTAVRGMTGIMVCFTILLSQEGEVIFHGDRLGGQIKAVFLLVLFLLGLVFPIADEPGASLNTITQNEPKDGVATSLANPRLSS